MAPFLACPSCGSELLQPLRSEPRKGHVVVELRCPECQTWVQETLCEADARALELAQAVWRHALREAYERSVTESMEALAFCLGMALDLDLLSADDFAPRRAPALDRDPR